MNTVTMESVLRVRSLECCHSNLVTTIVVQYECTKRTFLTLREHRFAVESTLRTLRTVFAPQTSARSSSVAKRSRDIPVSPRLLAQVRSMKTRSVVPIESELGAREIRFLLKCDCTAVGPSLSQ